MIYYYDTPNYCVALNPKTACTSFAQAIIKTFYPHIDEIINKTSTVFHGPTYICSCPRVETPQKPIVCLFRNPLERFASAARQTDISVDAAIDCLLNDKEYHFPVYSKPTKLRKNIHFIEQSKLVTKDAILFRFPEEIDAMAKFIGITIEMPHLNKSDKKIALSDHQAEFVASYYSKDMEIYKRLCR